jgi:hypothetical protein
MEKSKFIASHKIKPKSDRYIKADFFSSQPKIIPSKISVISGVLKDCLNFLIILKTEPKVKPKFSLRKTIGL